MNLIDNIFSVHYFLIFYLQVHVSHFRSILYNLIDTILLLIKFIQNHVQFFKTHTDNVE